MIFKHKKLSESVVMREFEKVALAKKMVKVEESVITKEASASYQPSNNLIDDMLKLANGLRGRGFEKDASSLEEKVLTYKLAETHLYRAIDEDAEDMLEFAHPKKDKIVFDAANGDGEIEDTLSQHKKILDIVNKQPKKVAFDVLAETADILGLKKKADFNSLAPIDAKIADVNFGKDQLVKILTQKSSIYAKIDDTLIFGNHGWGFPLIDGNKEAYEVNGDHFLTAFLDYFKHNSKPIITPNTWELFTSGSIKFDELITDEKVNNANGMLQSLYGDFLNKVKSLPEIKKENGVVDANSVNKFLETVSGLFDKNSEVILLALVGDDEKLKSEIENKIIPTMISGAKGLLENVSKQPENAAINKDYIDTANMIVYRLGTIVTTMTNDKITNPSPDIFKNVAEAIKANINDKKPFKDLSYDLVRIDNVFSKINNIHDLDNWAQAWQKNFSKSASKKELNVKTAQSLDPATYKSPTGPTHPAVYTKPAGRNAGRSAVKEQSNFETESPVEFKSVSTMQILLQTLADNLDKFPNTVNPNDIPKIKSILLGTGGIGGTYNTNRDGIWGPKTEEALKMADQITGGKLFFGAQRINGKLEGDNTPEKVANLADKNVAALNDILEKVHVAVPNKSKPVSSYLDNIPENSNLLQTDPPADEDENGVGLAPRDLNSFSGLSNFIRRNFQNLDFSAGGLNYQNWVTVLNWFYKRAYQQAKLLRNESDQDQAKANKAKYIAFVTNLYDDLNKFHDSLTNKDPAQIITPKELDGNTSLSSTNGPTQNAAYRTNNTNADGTEAQSDVNKPEAPPFGYEFNIVSLYKNYGHAMSYFDQYKDWLSIPLFNVNDFGYSPVQISAKYIKALTPQDILMLNGISNPNALIPGQTTTQYTYLNLMNSNVPAAISMRSRASDYALLSVVNGLSRDLPAIMSAYIQNSPSDQYNKIIANAWDKWSNNLAETRSRINSDFSSNGQIPKVIF
jgi:hypothetical protein